MLGAGVSFVLCVYVLSVISVVNLRFLNFNPEDTQIAESDRGY